MENIKTVNNEKDKIIRKNVLFAFIIKGLALIISFFSLPIYIRFFNDDATLGIWFTVLSILSWFLTFDFGIGNGLRNRLVKAIENKDDTQTNEYISSGYISLFYISVLFYLVALPIFLILNWNSVLNITTISNSILKITMIINLTTIMLQFFLRLITFILYSLQKSSVNNLITLITSATQVLIVLVIPSFGNEKNLIILSFVHMAATVIPLIIATIVVFSKHLKNMFPKREYYNKDKVKEILTSGGLIFINQILYMLLTATNVYIIAKMINPEEVVEYQAYYKIFILLGTLFQLALTPLWSAVTKAHVEKDYEWINKYFKISLILALIVFLGQFIIILPLQFGFNIWLKDNAPIVNYKYAMIIAAFGGVFTLQNTVSVFAMGFDKPKLQMYFYSVALVIKIVLILLLVNIYKNWATIVLIDIIIFVPYIIAEFFHVKNLIRLNEIKEVGNINVQ